MHVKYIKHVVALLDWVVYIISLYRGTHGHSYIILNDEEIFPIGEKPTYFSYALN